MQILVCFFDLLSFVILASRTSVRPLQFPSTEFSSLCALVSVLKIVLYSDICIFNFITVSGITIKGRDVHQETVKLSYRCEVSFLKLRHFDPSMFITRTRTPLPHSSRHVMTSAQRIVFCGYYCTRLYFR